MDKQANTFLEVADGPRSRRRRLLYVNRFCLLALIAILLSGCGGTGPGFFTQPQASPGSDGSGTGGGSATGGSGIATTPGEAQGIYTGVDPVGYTFYTIVLSDDMYYSIYGFPAADGSDFDIWGIMAGQGRCDRGTYTVDNLTDYHWSGVVAKKLNATYVPATSFMASITVLANHYVYSFNGVALSASGFDYGKPADLSHVTGVWTGTFLLTVGGSMSVDSDGSFSGIDAASCSFSGKLTPDGRRNFFHLTITTGGPPCRVPNQTASGVVFEHLLSNGATWQLLGGGVCSGCEAALILAAQR